MGCLIHGERCTCEAQRATVPIPPAQEPAPSQAERPILQCDFAGQFYEDLQIGGIVRRELSRGLCWHKKSGCAIDISFSLILLEWAGGIRRLFAEWQPEVGSPLALEEIPYVKMKFDDRPTLEFTELTYKRGEFRPQEASKIVADGGGITLGGVRRSPSQARKLAEQLMRAADFAEQKGCPADAMVE